jgi:hypothetical protein
MYRYLSDEAKVELLKNYTKMKELYRGFIRDIAETIKNRNINTIRENPELILRIMRSYIEISIYMEEMDELVMTAFLDPILLNIRE